MAIASYDVQPLFAEPYFRTNIGHAINDQQMSFIKKLPMVQNKVNLISENLNIFEEPELKSVKDAIQEALDIFAKEVMCITQKLYVTQSWSLINQPNFGMHGHSHSNSVISGSFYPCDLAEPVAGMIFDRHRTYQQLDIRPETEKQNLYNTPVNIVVPKKHDLILFSSSLQHVVQTNMSDKPRYSIAFNTFIKGTLGSHSDVSELVL